jgi:hypothetical protein
MNGITYSPLRTSTSRVALPLFLRKIWVDISENDPVFAWHLVQLNCAGGG